MVKISSSKTEAFLTYRAYSQYVSGSRREEHQVCELKGLEKQ